MGLQIVTPLMVGREVLLTEHYSNTEQIVNSLPVTN